MGTALIVILVVAAGILALAAWRYVATFRGSERNWRALNEEIAPIVRALEAGNEPPTNEIEAAARSPRTRSLLFRELRRMDREDLFPKDHSSLHLIAESDLVVWLMHPNELDAVPDEIEMVHEVTRSEGDPPETHTFFVFKFRTISPDKPAESKWYAGVAGPYWDRDALECCPPGVFSRFEEYELYSPEEHLRRTEELVLKAWGRRDLSS